MKVTTYLQVEPRWQRWIPYGQDKPKLDSLRVVGQTKERPRRPRSGTIVVKLTLDIADAAFQPLEPAIEIVIPAEHTDAVREAVSEPLDVPT